MVLQENVIFKVSGNRDVVTQLVAGVCYVVHHSLKTFR